MPVRRTRASGNHERDTDHGECDTYEGHSLHPLHAARSGRERDERRRGANDERRISGPRARYSVNEQELVQSIADYAEKEQADDVVPGKRETAAGQREHHQENRRYNNTESGEGFGTEDVRRVFDDDEIRSPDRRHGEEKHVRESKRMASCRVGNGGSTSN